MPRARKSNCDLRKSIVRETASITNADRVSPGASTLSASARSSSETRSGGMVRDLALDMNISHASQLQYTIPDSRLTCKFREWQREARALRQCQVSDVLDQLFPVRKHIKGVTGQGYLMTFGWSVADLLASSLNQFPDRARHLNAIEPPS